MKEKFSSEMKYIYMQLAITSIFFVINDNDHPPSQNWRLTLLSPRISSLNQPLGHDFSSFHLLLK